MQKRVLIIEDENFLASLMAEVLQKADLDVEISYNAEEGLKKLEKESFDIVLLDLILPGMSGFDFMEKIKKEEAKQIPIIIISNLGSQDDVQKGLSLGARAYLIKANILPEDLVKKVKEILQEKNS